MNNLKRASLCMSDANWLIVRGARTHNLKNISLRLPQKGLTVVTGVSGSGKSSLAFDTLFAEGQRRYVESLSVYARQFLSLLPRPDIDGIDGLSPAIAIDQNCGRANPRSNVGTATEIVDYLRLLYARAGSPYCPTHHRKLEATPIAAMADRAMALPEGTRLMILAPVHRHSNADVQAFFEKMLASGYTRFRVDGEMVAVYDGSEAVQWQDGALHDLDVVVDRVKIRADVRERLAQSFEAAAALAGGKTLAMNMATGEEMLYSSSFACPLCDYVVGSLEPRLFSSASPRGACAACGGVGVMPDGTPCASCGGTGLCAVARSVFLESAERNERWSIANLGCIPLDQLDAVFSSLHFSGRQQAAGEKILPLLRRKLALLVDLGLGYLTLDRRADTLSGGELQRLRLAGQIDLGLSGVLYVLDEPSIGLHPRDGRRLIEKLQALRDLGNTVVVVEHDEEMMRAADWLIDMGPGAGECGGEVVACGTPQAVMADPASITGAFLSGRRHVVAERPFFDPVAAKWLRLKGARGRSLKSVDIAVPAGALTVVTGVSGSGKSTLVNDTLAPALRRAFHQGEEKPLPYDSLDGLDVFDKVISVTQAPIGRTPRSNAATFTGLFSLIREAFAQTLTARERGYDARRFSFNVKGGRCEACEGEGVVKVEMQFLPDVYVPCEVCGGTRYNRETLEAKLKGLSIAEVLELTVDEALKFFAAYPQILRRLKALADSGLGYIRLGQSATTFSGGEAQRLKLAAELARPDTGHTLYLLDEPTTGLHPADVSQLLSVLRRLTALGNSVLVIEHDMDVAAAADWVIDIGPDAGEAGGKLVAAGTPEEVARTEGSATAPYLAAALAKARSSMPKKTAHQSQGRDKRGVQRRGERP